MPACSGEIHQRATWARRRGPSARYAGLAWRSVEFRCCSSTTPPSCSGIWLELREDLRGLSAVPVALFRSGARSRAPFCCCEQGHRWPLHRLPCIEVPDRPEKRASSLACGCLREISIATFCCSGSARAAAAERTATSKAKLSCPRTRAEREWVKISVLFRVSRESSQATVLPDRCRLRLQPFGLLEQLRVWLTGPGHV